MIFGRKKDNRSTGGDSMPVVSPAASAENLQGDMPLVSPEERDPFKGFRLFADTRHYPSQHPQTHWNDDGLYIFLNERMADIRVKPVREQQPYIFPLDDLPQGKWVRLSDPRGNPLPVAVKADPMGAMAKWLPLR